MLPAGFGWMRLRTFKAMKKTKIKFILPKWLVRAFWICVALGILGICIVFGIDAWVRHSAADRILTQEEAAVLSDVDCIVVLGCKVQPDGSLSHMLEDRLKRGIALYDLGVAPKLLMSGDHGRADYDEVAAMKRTAVEAGIPSEDVFMDHAGFCTYDSMWRAENVYDIDSAIVVTQKYHLTRALYNAEGVGMDACGVASDLDIYTKRFYRNMREVFARFKDFFLVFGEFEAEYTELAS